MNLGTTEECELLGDSKYRAYISQVEKALKNFEYTSEWADLISALGKLNKVLASHVKYPVIPKRVTIGKRLAQCLHPALPTGVHLKALETYDIIFKCIGTQRLATHLFTYSAGLFPLMNFAAMNVKPVLLQLYETHFVPLGQHIKPALAGLLMGLFPGLEEGAEYFDRTQLVLEGFRDAVDPTFFYGCLWECVLSGPSVRLAAINFVLAHYNKKQSMEDQLYFIGTNIDLLVEALCAAVEDSSVLVQRSSLDLLMIGFPIHSSPLTRPDMVKVVTAAIKVVLRRDMSLNRRLYAWLLGTDMSGASILSHVTTSIEGKHQHQKFQREDSISMETEMDYFYTYCKELLTQAVRNCIEETAEMESFIDGKPTNLRPFKILISLLDKPEIGSVIIEDVLIEIFRCMYKECMSLMVDEQIAVGQVRGGRNARRRDLKPKLQEKALNNEVIKTANLLFGTFETHFIWDFLSRLFEKSCSDGVGLNKQKVKMGKGDPCVTELCILIDFLLDKVSLDTFMENQTEHLPRLLRHITTSLYTHCAQLTDAELTISLKLCGKILTRVLPSMIPVIGEEIREGKSHGKTPASPADFDDASSEVYVSADSEAADSEASGKSPKKSAKKTKTKNTDKSAASDANETTEFSDFVQYDDTASTPEQWFSPKKSLDDSPQKQPLTLMQACSQCFQKLFCTLVSTKIIRDPLVVSALMEQLVLPADVMMHGIQEPVPDCDSGRRTGGGVKRLCLDHVNDELCEAFSSACQLLVDFSSFPMYCVNSRRIVPQVIGKGQDMKFPEWLRLLITCSCFVNHFAIQSAAISTMLDLMSLTKTAIEDEQVKGQDDEVRGEVTELGQVTEDGVVQARQRKPSEGRVSVVIVPVLSPAHLDYLQQQTGFYKLIACSLWQYLGDATPSSHQRSVDLLLQLHELAPTPWVCEDVIGNALLSDNKSLRIAGHKRFSVLWHLLREKQSKPMIGRTFDRSLFLMLDSLQNDTHPCRALTQTWLSHAIQRSDVGRILEPVLFILLHPDTARISIQHVNIHQPKRLRVTSESEDSVDSMETKIYAISSEGGNVIYHVSSSGGKTISGKTSEELRTYALTSISDAGSSTRAARAKMETELHFEKVNSADLNLRVNPFGSETDLDRADKMIVDGLGLPALQQAQIGKARRLDGETCKKEGIYFDDEQGSNSTSVAGDDADSVEMTPSEIASSIMDEMINSIVRSEEGSMDAQPVLQDLGDNVDSRTGSMMDLSAKTESTLSDRVRAESVPDLSKRGRLESVQSKDTMSLGPDELLNAIDSKMLEIDSQSETDGDHIRSPTETRSEIPRVHPLHTHILLYTQKYDAQRTLYALTCLKAVLNTSPRLVACALATTNISNTHTPQYAQLQNLLVRHRRSVFGKNFFSEVPGDAAGTYRSCMYVEILISMCLYFMRSYYPNLMMSKLTELELNGNKEVQILSCEILTILLSELASVAKDSGKGFATYISDILNKCKVQKSLLHCVLASVYNARKKMAGEDIEGHITEAIISFNEENMDANTNETFQLKLLKLLLVNIILEDQIRKVKSTEGDALYSLPQEWDRSRVNFQPSLASVKFTPSQPVIYQKMFLSAIMSALKQQHLCHMHRHWVAMVTSALPYMSRALSFTVTSVIQQLCRNVDLLAQPYELGPVYRSGPYQPSKAPPDHVLTLLEGMTTICHYTLLDNAQQDITVGQFFRSNSASEVVSETATPGQILTNLIHVFNPSTSREPSPAKDVSTAFSPILETRRHLLSILPRILASLTVLWKGVKVSHDRKHNSGKDEPCWTLGSPKQIKQFILGFVSPIALHHGVNLLGAVAVVWNDRRQRSSGGNKKQVIPVAGDDQLLLVDLVSAIKVLPMDTLIVTTKQVIKQPPPTTQDNNKKRTPLEVNMLQFFYAYMQRSAAQQLLDSWPSLLTLLKDALQLNLVAPGQFLLLAILNEFVQKVPMFEERKDQKDLQEIAQKLLEACGEIAGASLEQTTWLRRNLAVKPGPQVDVHVDVDDTTTDQETESPPSNAPPPAPAETKQPTMPATQHNHRQYSVQALVILAELTANLLDVVYRSEEKDRVGPLLHSILHNVFPYLKNHRPHNLPSFRACSQMLSSLSGYQYTRKAWKKDVFELLLDPSFFQMDQACIAHWRVVVDNLMTHDKTTFKDLLARVTVTTGTSLNLFTSREQEFEQRAQLLKRLSFTIFCSELDQYMRAMPDIQERLAESFKMTAVPSLQAQVFLCFRVLILRVSPRHLTSLWPTMITELVQVLLQIEQELLPDLDETRSQVARLANLDPSWTLGNGLNTHHNPHWLHLYLSACKLLDLALVMPAEDLPQFQLYRWAFIAEPHVETDKRKLKLNQHRGFVPHVIRIARLMQSRFGEPDPEVHIPGHPMLTDCHITSVQDLHPFFHTMAQCVHSSDGITMVTPTTKTTKKQTTSKKVPKSVSAPDISAIDTAALTNGTNAVSYKSTRQALERLVENDFLDSLPRA